MRTRITERARLAAQAWLFPLVRDANLLLEQAARSGVETLELNQGSYLVRSVDLPGCALVCKEQDGALVVIDLKTSEELSGSSWDDRPYEPLEPMMRVLEFILGAR